VGGAGFAVQQPRGGQQKSAGAHAGYLRAALVLGFNPPNKFLVFLQHGGVVRSGRDDEQVGLRDFAQRQRLERHEAGVQLHLGHGASHAYLQPGRVALTPPIGIGRG